MSEFVITRYSYDAQKLKRFCNLDINQLSDPRCQHPTWVKPYTPYLLDAYRNGASYQIQQMLVGSHAPQIVQLAECYDPEETVALAELFGNLRRSLVSEPSAAAIGAAATVYGERMEGFSKSVARYQQALITYHQQVKAKSPQASAARQNAQAAFDRMQSNFHHELDTLKHRAGRRGTPLTNSRRGLNMARSSRDMTRLRLDNTASASQLVQFARHTKLLGNGLAVVDFGSRAGNIHATYQAGGDWHREMFVESSSFALSASVGTLTAKAGLACLVFATPAGWTALLVGAAISGMSAGAAITANQLLKDQGLAASAYDRIQEVIAR